MSVPTILGDVLHYRSGVTPQNDYGTWWDRRDIFSPLPTPEELVIFKEELDNAYSSMSNLTDMEFNVFMMKYFDNYKISEISKQHNLTRSKVETTLTNTKKNIRQQLQSRGKLI